MTEHGAQINSSIHMAYVTGENYNLNGIKSCLFSVVSFGTIEAWLYHHNENAK